MNKKKLPKAVTRTAEDMRRTGAPDQSAKTSPAEVSAQSSSSKSKVETVPMLQPASSTDIMDRSPSASRRMSKANAIVERYSNFSTLGGAIPLPLLNVAGVTIIILKMVKELCKLYGVPFQHGRARAIVVGLAGGAVPTTASTIATSTLVFVIPGVNLVGLAVSAVTASVCTRAIGRRFVEHFETGANLLDFPVIERRKSRPQ